MTSSPWPPHDLCTRQLRRPLEPHRKILLATAAALARAVRAAGAVWLARGPGDSGTATPTPSRNQPLPRSASTASHNRSTRHLTCSRPRWPPNGPAAARTPTAPGATTRSVQPPGTDDVVRVEAFPYDRLGVVASSECARYPSGTPMTGRTRGNSPSAPHAPRRLSLVVGPAPVESGVPDRATRSSDVGRS